MQVRDPAEEGAADKVEMRFVQEMQDEEEQEVRHFREGKAISEAISDAISDAISERRCTRAPECSTPARCQDRKAFVFAFYESAVPDGLPL